MNEKIKNISNLICSNLNFPLLLAIQTHRSPISVRRPSPQDIVLAMVHHQPYMIDMMCEMMKQRQL